MGTRSFCPVVGDPLEARVVLTGHPAIVLTTNTFYNANAKLNAAIDHYNNKVDIDPSGELAARNQLVRDLRAMTKTIPYGQKVLLPAMVNTALGYIKIGARSIMDEHLHDKLEEYITENSEAGFIKYLQSNVRHGTDDLIPTQGHVPKGSKK